MGKPNFSDEFKRDAVIQITERGYPVAEVSRRRGVRQKPPSFSTSTASTTPAAAIHIWAASARSHSKPRWLNEISDRRKTVTSPDRLAARPQQHRRQPKVDPANQMGSQVLCVGT